MNFPKLGPKLSRLFLFGTARMIRECEESDWLNEGMHTLPNLNWSDEEVMSEAECRQMFETGEYPQEVADRLGYELK